jgi:hypothetical protein
LLRTSRNQNEAARSRGSTPVPKVATTKYITSKWKKEKKVGIPERKVTKACRYCSDERKREREETEGKNIKKQL